MLRHIAFGCFVVGFAAFAFTGLAGWVRTRDVGPRDEEPLQIGYFPPGHKAVHDMVMMSNPWRAQAEDTARLKRDLPPDPWGVDAADEIEKANRRLVHDLAVKMPAGRLTWPEVVAGLKENFERADLRVLTGKPEVPSSVVVDVPNKKWTGFEILSFLMNATQRAVEFDVTSEGLAVGSVDACKKARLHATLTEARRRVALANADKRLDATFRPDLMDATIVAFARSLTSQTEVEVVVDGRIWEMNPAIKWRGEPRSLRDALTEFCDKLPAFWRYHDGRVWLLRP